jgi:hypothetical protein
MDEGFLSVLEYGRPIAKKDWVDGDRIEDWRPSSMFMRLLHAALQQVLPRNVTILARLA